MNLYINDLPFNYQFDNQYTALKELIKWGNLCYRIIHDRAINNQKMTELERVFSQGGNQTYKCLVKDTEISIVALINQIENKDMQRFIFYILTDLPDVNAEGCSPFVFKGNESKGCTVCYKENGLLVSLLTNNIFKAISLNGTIDNNQVTIGNISDENDLNRFRKELGILKYSGNPKHGIMERIFKKGTASPMTLGNIEAQKLLNESIPDSRNTSEKRYAKLNGVYYTFQHTRDNEYHGYEGKPTDSGMLRIVDNRDWE